MYSTHIFDIHVHVFTYTNHGNVTLEWHVKLPVGLSLGADVVVGGVVEVEVAEEVLLIQVIVAG